MIPASISPRKMALLRARAVAYRSKKQALLAHGQAQGLSGQRTRRALRALARLTDETLRAIWQLADLSGQGTALVAVGGYGRGELLPFSDVDVLILLPEHLSASATALEARIERFISACWDAGLDISSSVRTIADCMARASADVMLQTSLLQSRFMAGDATGCHELVRQLRQGLNPAAFFVAKTLEMQQRHIKYDHTPYALEPNCKESPGGLRDLHTILWVAQAAGLGQTWDDLAQQGLANALEIKQIKANEALLSTIRARLHLLAQRREDRLVFDLQSAVAQSFGWPRPPRRARPSAAAQPPSAYLASQALMKRYYRAAKAVTQLSHIVLLNIQERLQAGSRAAQRRLIAPHFFEADGLLEVAHDQLYSAHPEAILQTFLLYQTHPNIKALSVRTLRALYNARALMNATFRRQRLNRDTFLRILQAPEGITRTLRLMNQTSVLGRYLRPFGQVVGQMQYDLFHAYTVDQHTLLVVRNLRRFFIAEHSHEHPFCAQLAAGWSQPWILYIAALFHDLAKGRGGNHCVLGAQQARTFCREHGISATDTQLIAWMVSEHLSMSHTAQKTDLSDPDVIRAFAQRVGHERQLSALYLLTVADIRGTSPHVWNPWKGKLLEDLYRLTLRALGGRTPEPGSLIQARKQQALALMGPSSSPHRSSAELDMWWESLGVRYFMRHQPEDIAWHTQVLTQRPQGPASSHENHHPQPLIPERCIVQARILAKGEGLQVLVYSAGQPDLFARICGYVDTLGYSILDARVHTTAHGCALDTFHVLLHPALPCKADQGQLVALIERELSQTIDQQTALPEPRKSRLSRRVRSFPLTPRIDLRPDEKAQHWILSISAHDRVGLLYRISRLLARHGIGVELAKITTLGERAEDTFLISGPALQSHTKQIAIKTELLQTLGSTNAAPAAPLVQPKPP